ncbi:hypothetical protein SAY87_005541 [Trapa incisa]|uniref:DUF3752 domain-containing protein n=1 Tax=Trapa incisa TaxID=236973 RepID=A0AAN7K325_9MYRT|nr:hypothetical protein SAY87_005541 [Trapa incisa]
MNERSLVKHLKKLFFALNLKENGGVFLLPSDSRPVLEMVGPAINAHLESISMEGDEELLVDIEVNVPSKRDEWMATLSPERKQPKAGIFVPWFSFHKPWYLEAYNEATAIASNEDDKRMTADAELVDMYNKAKRSKSLVEKHQKSQRACKEEVKAAACGERGLGGESSLETMGSGEGLGVWETEGEL